MQNTIHRAGQKAGCSRKLVAGAALSQSLRIAMLAALASPAFADVGVTGQVGYSENAGRYRDGPSDVTRTYILDANLGRQTELFDIYFDYRANKEDWRDNVQADREYVNGAGVLRWKILPETLAWELSNRRANQIIEAERPEIPDNQQVVSVVSTGPTLNLALGSSNAVSLSADYSQVDYEESGWLDNDSKGVAGVFTHSFSSALSGSLNGNWTETEFEGAFSGLDYRVGSVSAAVAFQRGALTLAAEGGEYEIRRKSLGDSNEPLQAFSLGYQINSRSSISASAGKSVRELANDQYRWYGYVLDDQGGFGEQQPSLVSSDAASIYKLDDVSLTYNYRDESRFNLGLTYSEEEREFGLAGSRESWESLSASLNIPVGQRLSVDLQARLSDLDFSLQDRAQERREFSAGLNYRLSENFSIRLRAWKVDQDGDRDGDQDVYSWWNYDDSGASLSLSYRFGDW